MDYRQQIANEIDQLVIRKSSKASTSLAKYQPAVLLTKSAKCIAQFPKPPMENFPVGIPQTEVIHLLRCDHTFANNNAERLYRNCYNELRDEQLDGGRPRRAPQLLSLVEDISSAKMMCGTAMMRRGFTRYRLMLLNFIKYADSILKVLYQNIKRCTVPELDVGNLKSVTDDMQQIRTLLFLHNSTGYFDKFYCNLLDHPVNAFAMTVAFHSYLVWFKLDCMTELMKFNSTTCEHPIQIDLHKSLQTAKANLREAFKLRQKAIAFNEMAQIRAIVKTNESIEEWEKEVLVKLRAEKDRMIGLRAMHLKTSASPVKGDRLASARSGSASTSDVKLECNSLDSQSPISARTRASERLSPTEVASKATRRSTRHSISRLKLESAENSDSDSPHPSDCKKRLSSHKCLEKGKVRQIIKRMEEKSNKMEQKGIMFKNFCEESDQVLYLRKFRKLKYYKQYNGIAEKLVDKKIPYMWTY